MDRNGYIQVENKADGTYLQVFKPEGNGKSISLDEVITYLNRKNVFCQNLIELRRVYEEALNGGSIRVSDEQTPPFSGWCEVVTQPDGMKLNILIYPPMVGMQDVDMNEVMSTLKQLKVKHGIQEQNLEEMINKKLYFTPIVAALGTDAIDGYDAELTYLFNTVKSTKPQVNDDGTVDFHKIANVNHVNEGDVVAEIKPEDPGIPGMNIYGVPIKPKKVYKKSFKYGNKLKVSDCGTQLISLVTGQVALEGDKIFVSDEYDVKSDVDISTGDIEFEGDVRVHGNVLAGYKITASGNVVVDGVVEGAEIIAGGNIILRRGIQGMSKGLLKADGNIVAMFIENARVCSGGNIDTDAILHSTVTARGSIEIHGKNGYLIGGTTRAGSILVAKYIGSEMGTTTVVGVGTDPELLASIEKLKQQIKKSTQDKEKLQQFVTMLRKKQEIEGKLDAEKTLFLQKSLKSVILLDQSLKEMAEQCRKDSEMVHEDSNARIKVTGSIYQGVKLEFGDICLFIRDKNDFCQYIKKDGEVTRIAL